MQRRQHGDRDRSCAWIRPQPQIGAEDVAIGGAFLQQRHQQAHNLDPEDRRLDSIGKLIGPRLVNRDEVDIARIVEFVRALLTHGQKHQAARRRSLAKPFALLALFGERKAEGGFHGGIGKAGQATGHRGKIDSPGKICQSQTQRKILFCLAKAGHRLRPRRPIVRLEHCDGVLGNPIG